MAAVAAGTPFGVPERRLISSVTGTDFALSGDPAGLLATQLERTAMLASALRVASPEADLVLLATPDEQLAAAAAACCRLPVTRPPLEADGRLVPEVLAALFTAGAIGSPLPFLPGPRRATSALPEPAASLAADSEQEPTAPEPRAPARHPAASPLAGPPPVAVG